MNILDSKNLAVLVVDMQDFFLKKLNLEVRKELISNQQKVVDYCCNNDIKVIFFEYDAGGVPRGHVTRLLKNSVTTSAKTMTIIKKNNSGFTKTKLDDILKKLKIKKILIMGVNANGCVQDTSISAIKRGYRVITCNGLIASSSRSDMNLSSNNKRWYVKNTKIFDRVDDLFGRI